MGSSAAANAHSGADKIAVDQPGECVTVTGEEEASLGSDCRNDMIQIMERLLPRDSRPSRQQRVRFWSDGYGTWAITRCPKASTRCVVSLTRRLNQRVAGADVSDSGGVNE